MYCGFGAYCSGMKNFVLFVSSAGCLQILRWYSSLRDDDEARNPFLFTLNTQTSVFVLLYKCPWTQRALREHFAFWPRCARALEWKTVFLYFHFRVFNYARLSPSLVHRMWRNGERKVFSRNYRENRFHSSVTEICVEHDYENFHFRAIDEPKLLCIRT